MTSKAPAKRTNRMSTKDNSQASAPDADPVAQLPGMFISSPAPKGSSRAATRSSTTADTVQPTNPGTSSTASSEVVDLAGSPDASNADRSKAENSTKFSQLLIKLSSKLENLEI